MNALASAGFPVGGSTAPDLSECSVEVLGFGALPSGLGEFPRGLPSAEDGGTPMVFLRASDGAQELLVAGTAVRPTDRGDGAARAASAWREQWFRLWRRSQLSGKLIAFFDELNGAETTEQICSVVARHTLEMVGGYKAVVFLPNLDSAAGEVASGDVRLVGTLRESRMGRAGLVLSPDLRQVAEPWWAELGAFLGDREISTVAHVPFGERGVLLLAERRHDRIFVADDWEVLATLAEQGDRAITRAQAMESAYELSLTDPLTGLANRRQMEVVLRHAWAAAERGEGLAVTLFDLDGFKQLNDSYGHAFGDQILVIAAQCLREEARGADAVVRYGGDEFLVILPRGTVAGARSLAARVRKRLQGWVGISAGVAEYSPRYLTSLDLIHAADEDLYRTKARRSLARSPEPGVEV